MSTLKHLAVVGTIGLVGSIALANATARKHGAPDRAVNPPQAAVPCTVPDNAVPPVTGNTFDAAKSESATPCQ